MALTIPAASLIAVGLCTGGCLLALDDDCDCRCAGRWHGALVDAPVPAHQLGGTNLMGNRPAVEADTPTLLADVLAALGEDDRAHSDQLCARLALVAPDTYTGWGPTELARALLAHGVRTRQINLCGETGEQVNRRGVVRPDVLAAIRRARRAAG